MKIYPIIRKYIQLFSGLALVSSFVLDATASASIVPTFSDSFDRADGAIGNDWAITSSGNGGGGGGTAPTAVINDGKLLMSRSGWGPDARITASHLFDSSNTVTASLAITSPANTATGTGRLGIRASNSITKAYVYVDLTFNYQSQNFSLRVGTTENGVWSDWKYIFPTSGSWVNPGEISISIGTSDLGEVSIATIVASTGERFVNIPSFLNAGLSDSGFDKVELLGNWAGWTSPSGATFNVMSVSAGNQIPEGKNIALVLAAAGLCFRVLRKRGS